ncbi:MAG: flagellin [Enterocloster clostridioformis]
MRNINDGIGMTRTGEGALAEVHSMLHRMKTLAIQAAKWHIQLGCREPT